MSYLSGFFLQEFIRLAPVVQNEFIRQIKSDSEWEVAADSLHVTADPSSWPDHVDQNAGLAKLFVSIWYNQYAYLVDSYEQIDEDSALHLKYLRMMLNRPTWTPNDATVALKRVDIIYHAYTGEQPEDIKTAYNPTYLAVYFTVLFSRMEVKDQLEILQQIEQDATHEEDVWTQLQNELKVTVDPSLWPIQVQTVPLLLKLYVMVWENTTATHAIYVTDLDTPEKNINAETFTRLMYAPEGSPDELWTQESCQQILNIVQAMYRAGAIQSVSLSTAAVPANKSNSLTVNNKAIKNNKLVNNNNAIKNNKLVNNNKAVNNNNAIKNNPVVNDIMTYGAKQSKNNSSKEPTVPTVPTAANNGQNIMKRNNQVNLVNQTTNGGRNGTSVMPRNNIPAIVPNKPVSNAISKFIDRNLANNAAKSSLPSNANNNLVAQDHAVEHGDLDELSQNLQQVKLDNTLKLMNGAAPGYVVNKIKRNANSVQRNADRVALAVGDEGNIAVQKLNRNINRLAENRTNVLNRFNATQKGNIRNNSEQLERDAASVSEDAVQANTDVARNQANQNVRRAVMGERNQQGNQRLNRNGRNVAYMVMSNNNDNNNDNAELDDLNRFVEDDNVY